MSTQIDRAYVNQFSANVMMLAQQMDARLVGAVRNETLTGEFGFFDQIGSVDPVERTTRHADTPFTEVPHARRRVGGRDFEASEIIDKQDVIRMLQDPQSSYARAFAAGFARRRDAIIMEAFWASAPTGKTGTTLVPFPGGQQIAVDYVETGSTTNSSLTIGKLRRAREILMDAEVGEDGFFIACTQREINALLRTTEVSSADFNSVKALVNGEVNSFMGFNFIRLPSARFLLDGSSHRRIPVWNREGMLFAALQEPEMNAAPDPTKGFNIRLHMRQSFGATRMEEARVVEIKCSTSVF
jgi:hypothetical protein